MSAAEDIAAEVWRLINESPRTPTKAQLTDCISVMLDVVKDDHDLAVPPGTVVHPTRPGAYVQLIDLATMTLQVDGWTASSSRPLTNQEGALAVIEWLRKGVLSAPRQ